MHVGREESLIHLQPRSSEKSDGLCPNDVPGFKTTAASEEFFCEGRVTRISENQRQKNSARRIVEISWVDRLLFMAIAGCMLSASGMVPKALSSVAVEFLLVCSLVLTAVILFRLLFPVNITGSDE